MKTKKWNNEFLSIMKTTKNLSEKSIIAYHSDLEDYFNFIQRKKRFFFHQEMIYQYLDYLQNQKKLKDSTIIRKMTTLKMYYSFLEDCHNYKNPFYKIKIKFKKEKKLPKILTREEIKKILEVLYNALNDKNTYQKFESYRDLALIDLLISTGIRIGEACKITLLDIQKDKTILIHGKGRKQRMIYISSDKTWQNLNQYIFIRKERKCNHDILFINKYGNKLSINGIDNIYRKYKKLSNINPQSTPHFLRHTFATNLLSNGADIRSVQELLGHTNISTTKIYTEVTANRKVEVLNKFNFRNEL